MFLVLSLFLSLAGAEDLHFPNPKIAVDYRAFGDVAKDVNAKRKFLRAVTRSYMELYVQEFLAKNHIKENLFPNSMIPASVKAIDALPDDAVMKADDTGYGVLKAKMDEAAGFYYQHLIGANKADKNKSEIMTELRAMEKRAIDVVAQRDEETKRILSEAEKRAQEEFKKLDMRLKELEVKGGLKGTSVTPTMEPQSPPGLSSKNDRMLLYAALGISVLSLLLGLRRKT
jgi:hypothetical protein